MRANAAEMVRLAEFVEERWERPGPWRRVTSFWTDFSHLEVEDLWEAMRLIYQNGSKTAPTPSELLKTAKEISRAKGRRIRSDEHDGKPHVWGIYEDAPDGRRLGVCVVCKLEEWFPPGVLLSDAERDSAKRRPRVVDPDDDPTQDRSR